MQFLVVVHDEQVGAESAPNIAASLVLGDAWVPTGAAGNFRIAPNTANSPNGFGGSAQFVTQSPRTATQSGLILTAESIKSGDAVLPPDPDANVGFRFVDASGNLADPGLGVHKILIGSLNFVVGSIGNDTTYQISNVPFNQNTTQQGRGLDKSNGAPGAADSWTGTSTPIGGFFTFTVAAAIPEPSSMALCGLVACGMSYAGYRRRKTAVVDVVA